MYLVYKKTQWRGMCVVSLCKSDSWRICSAELRCPGFEFGVNICCIVLAETVVAESVVVIKKLLQTQPTQHSEIIKHMAKLFDNITVRRPFSRSISLVWDKKTDGNLTEFAFALCRSNPAGPHGPGQHPVADGRVLREGAKNCTWCSAEDGQDLHRRGGHCEAADCQPGSQTVSDQLQAGTKLCLVPRVGVFLGFFLVSEWSWGKYCIPLSLRSKSESSEWPLRFFIIILRHSLVSNWISLNSQLNALNRSG